MKRTALCIVLLCLTAAILIAQPEDMVENDQALQQRICSYCHPSDLGLLNRYSQKTWELIVMRMQNYASNTAISFDSTQAVRIVDYLAHFDVDAYYDNQLAEPAASGPAQPLAARTTTPPDAPADSTAAPAPAEATPAEPTSVTAQPGPPASAYLKSPRAVRLARRSPRARMIPIAKKFGLVGIAALITLGLTGICRPLLRKSFRIVHVLLGFVAFVVITAHAAILFYEFGAPHVAWLWCGIMSFLAFVVAQFGGKLRQLFGQQFLKVHIVAALAALALALCHWFLL